MAKRFCKGQIWVETVIYTLIGLAIIGTVLAIATPAINKYKDKTLIEQTISMMQILNDKVLEARESVGSVRVVDFRIKEGSFELSALSNNITYVLGESKLEYSEPGVEIKQGDIKILTQKTGKTYIISLTLSYSGKINLKSAGTETSKTFSQAPNPYKISIENTGYDSTSGITTIDIKEI